MKSVVQYQTVGVYGAIGNIVASVGVQQYCLSNVCSAANPPGIQLSNRRFDNRQRISAMIPPNVQVDCKTGLVGQTLDKCSVPAFAIALAGH